MRFEAGETALREAHLKLGSCENVPAVGRPAGRLQPRRALTRRKKGGSGWPSTFIRLATHLVNAAVPGRIVD